jgi:hypothetical protein
MRGVPLDFEIMIRILAKHEVEYIVIGGVCATLYGALINTGDLDIVYSREEKNRIRLEAALRELNAYYREHPPFRFIPDAERINTPGHHLLMTSSGPLDLLGSVTGQRGYAELLPHTVAFTLDDDVEIRMVTLPMLITLKTEAGRTKDKITVPVLKQILKEMEAEQQAQEDDSTP